MAGAEHGGAEAFFERLAVALHKAGVKQQLLIRKNPEREARLRDAGLAVATAPFGGPLDLVTRWGFAFTIRRWRPDVVLTWMNRATGFCPVGDFVQVGRLGGYYNLKHYRHCRHLVANTTDIRDWIVNQGWPAERAHYLPNFVDAATAEPASKAALSTPDDTKVILALGRLHPNKAFDVLIKALAKVPGAVLWIAGEGPLRAELETLVDGLDLSDRVRFLGWRQDVPALLAAADVFVCPSRHEPLGNVVIEGWAHARPVVAAASQGPSQLVKHGVDGLLVPVDDADALAESVNRVLVDAELAARLAVAGRNSFQARFTEAAVVDAYVQFLNTVAG